MIGVFNYANGTLMKTLDSHKSEVTGLVYVSSRQQLLSCSWDRTVKTHADQMHMHGCVCYFLAPLGSPLCSLFYPLFLITLTIHN